MTSIKAEVKKLEEFTINELAIIKDEIETLILKKHPAAKVSVQIPELDAKIADQDKTGYVPPEATIVDSGTSTATFTVSDVSGTTVAPPAEVTQATEDIAA